MSLRVARPDQDFGPEWSALELLAGRPAPPEEPDRFDRLLHAPDFRLSELVEQAMCHKLVYRLAAYLERSELDDVVDAGVRESMRTLLQANRYRTALLRSEAVGVARALGDRGLRFACTKGIIFESALYGADGTRAMRDIDFMIRPEDRSAVSATMAQLGFTVGRYNWRRGTIEFDRRTELTYKLNPDHLPNFSRRRDDPLLPCAMFDFANSFTWTNSPWQIPLELCLENLRSQPVPGTDFALPRLAPPFELLFTILHVFREGWLEQTVNTGLEVDLAKFSDVLNCFRTQSAEILDGGFREIVDRFGLRESVLWVLEHLDRTLQTRILPTLGWEGLASDAWLASARGLGGTFLTWRGTMRERLHSRDRSALFDGAR